MPIKRGVEEAAETDLIEEADTEGHMPRIKIVEEAETEGHAVRVRVVEEASETDLVEDADTEGHMPRIRPPGADSEGQKRINRR